MAAYLKNLPALLAGEVTRKESAVLESGKFAAAVVGGTPLTLENGVFRAWKKADAALPYGIATRIAPQSPDYDGIGGVFVRGYISVAVASGTPARGAAVYLNADGAFTAEASTSGTANTAYTGAVWAVDGVSDEKLGEIRIL